jgi:protein-S-isoprenylcysteine O-methyltransferase Ste14
MIALHIGLIILLYASFGVVHSVLAALSLKKNIARNFPGFMPYYRLSYNVFALIHFSVVYELTPRIDVRLYDLQFPYDFIILFFQLQMVLGILWTFRYFNLKEFLGINQILRAYGGDFNVYSLDEESELIIQGPYLWCRHPLYFFTLMFLLLRPYMFLDYLISLLCIGAYFYIGAVWEEKRMLEKFDAHYREYMAHVPRIFPFAFRKRVPGT